MDNYILAYYQQIQDGTATVGRWVRLAYEMIVRGLEAKTYTYNHKKAQAAVLFIENFCRHHEGELAPQHIKLELWQKAFISVIFGIMDNEGARQFREVFLVVARKNGKTLLAAAIAAYCTFLDGEYGGRVYFAAPKLEQANLCFEAYYQMIVQEPELNAMAQKRRTDVYVKEWNATAKPLAFSAKKSDGLNVSLAVCDECASWQGDAGLKFYEVIKSSFGARRQPLLLAISTAGYVNEGVYDELMKRASRVLMGDSQETRMFPLLYTIDDIEKWNDINELRKANPNLGVSVSVDYLLEEIAIAEGSLSKKGEFLTKYCNIKQNSSTAWLATETIAKCSGKHLQFEDFRDHYAVVGVDLSRTTDLTAVVCCIEKDGIINVFAHFYLPRNKLEEATARDNLPYAIYEKRGQLTLSGENFVDYADCYRWICDLIEKYKVYPLQLGYDRYCAQQLVQDLQKRGIHCDDVFQGTNLTPVIRETEGLLKDGKINLGDNDLLKIHLLNSALKMETESDRVKLIKVSQTAHVDGAAALLDAMCVRQKWWREIGNRLTNNKR